MMGWYRVSVTVNVPPYEAGVIANIAEIIDPEAETDSMVCEVFFDSGLPFLIDCVADAYGRKAVIQELEKQIARQKKIDESFGEK